MRANPSTTRQRDRIVFRTWRDTGDVIALFPAIPWNLAGDCTSYMHVGQHGAADYRHVVRASRPATPAEYANLARELTTRGYNLQIMRRARYAR